MSRIAVGESHTIRQNRLTGNKITTCKARYLYACDLLMSLVRSPEEDGNHLQNPSSGRN